MFRDIERRCRGGCGADSCMTSSCACFVEGGGEGMSKTLGYVCSGLGLGGVEIAKSWIAGSGVGGNKVFAKPGPVG